MSSGWSSSFDGSSTWPLTSVDSPLLPPTGLHCGPSGRATLLHWLEQNYQLKSDRINENPGVEACKMWQETQGFQDEKAKSIVSFLRTLKISRNRVYKTLFEKYLKKKLLGKIEKSKKPYESLEKIALRMMQMLQVRQMQPLIASMLEKFDELPESLMTFILEDTQAAAQFYNVC
ncbi:hypothetical protein IE077_001988, partial [Cardiosporidium cionae]